MQPGFDTVIWHYSTLILDCVLFWRDNNRKISFIDAVWTPVSLSLFADSTQWLSLDLPTTPRTPGQLRTSSRLGGDPGFEKRRGRGDITYTARPPCRHSGSLFCCFGLSGATAAPSAEKVGKWKRKRRGKNVLGLEMFACFFAFELLKLSRRALTVRPTTS